MKGTKYKLTGEKGTLPSINHSIRGKDNKYVIKELTRASQRGQSKIKGGLVMLYNARLRLSRLMY